MRTQPLRRRLAHSAIGLLFGAARVDAAATPLPRTGVFRVLICRITHSLGNTLLLTPLIREIESVYPGAEIDVLTRSEVAERIFGAFRSIRHVFRLPARALAHPLAVLRLLKRIRSTPYDLVIDPDPNSQTGRLMQLLARGRFKLGFAGARKAGALAHGVAVPASTMHAAHLPVYLLRRALASGTASACPTLDLRLDAAEREQGAAVLVQLVAPADPSPPARGIIGVFANATGHKFLGVDWWRRFLAVFEAHCADYALIEIVPASGISLLGERYPAFYSSDIRKLAGVLSGLSRVVTADCGVMHLACASATPVTAIFTVTDPDEWGPYGRHDCVVHARGLTPEQAAECALQAAGEAPDVAPMRAAS